MSNRYIVEGLATDMFSGKTVVYLAPERECQETFTALVELAREIGARDHLRIVRAHGRQCVEHGPSGRVLFHRSVQAMRGLVADVIVVADRKYIERDDDWVGIRVSTQNGEVIRTC